MLAYSLWMQLDNQAGQHQLIITLHSVIQMWSPLALKTHHGALVEASELDAANECT